MKYIYLVIDHHRNVQDVYKTLESAKEQALKDVNNFYDSYTESEVRAGATIKYIVNENGRPLVYRSVVRRIIKS
ncbi:MAG: hypothetical protein HRT87_04510 [Legionellales bacterium]|nr:hypothetical protein [Legionellales bacterium]